MKEIVVAAIVGAINAYIQQEEQVGIESPRIVSLKAVLYHEPSAWQFFGRQQLIRTRTNWWIKRGNR